MKPDHLLDAADLALIEIDPNATERELRLVAEIRYYQEDNELVRKEAAEEIAASQEYSALEDAQEEAAKAEEELTKVASLLPDEMPQAVYESLSAARKRLTKIGWL